MSLSTNYPAIRPSLVLDFANTTRLDPRLTFTRSTVARYYDGYTSSVAEQNLITDSQDFNNASWSVTNTTITPNTTAAPNGTTTADTLTETATAGEHRVTRTSQYIADFAAPFRVSVFVRANTRTWAYLYNGSGGAGAVFFNLSTGVVGTNTNSSIISSPSITAYGSSWYRISALFSNGGGTGRQIAVGLSSADNTISYTGDGTSSIFVWGFQLELRTTLTAYTATTTVPITNYVPTLLTAAINQPRFDHNPITGVSQGLMIEEPRTNLLLRSQELNTSPWSQFNSVTEQNIIVAPDGTITGNKIIANTANNQHIAIQNVAITGGNVYSWSCYAKAGEYTRIQFNRADIGGVAAVFNLATGVVESATPGTATITPVGNGWYRCVFIYTPPTTGTMSVGFQPLSALGASFIGDSYSGVYVWGTQFETGAFNPTSSVTFASSYIATTSGTNNRGGDTAGFNSANLGWYNHAQGTVCVNYQKIGQQSNSAYITGFGTAGVGRFFRDTSANLSDQRRGGAAGTQDFSFGPSPANGSNQKIIMTYINGTTASTEAATYNGVAPTTSAAYLVSTPYTNFSFYDLNGTPQSAYYIQQVSVYTQALTNAQLQNLTKSP